MINFAVIGAGRIGRIHAANVAESPACHIHSIVDPFPEAATTLATALNAKVSTVEDVLADPEIHAVVICTPTDTHCNLIERSARAGKAVFCEKPVDLDISRARDCAATVRETGVVCALGFNRRYDPTFNSLKQRIADGAIGATEQVIITSRDPSPPPAEYVKQSGGLFRDMMIHDLDMACWLLGEKPVEVYATGSCLVDPAIGEAGDIDSAMVILKTASGKICHINNSRRSVYGYDQRIEVFGSEGMVQAGNHKPSEVTVSNHQGVSQDQPEHFFLERYRQAYKIELQNFIDALLSQEGDGKQLLTNIDDGINALELADACVASMATGKRIEL